MSNLFDDDDEDYKPESKLEEHGVVSESIMNAADAYGADH